MKKYYFVILIALFLQGCSKNDDQIAGKGKIRHDGYVCQIENVYHRILEESVILDDTLHLSYYHVLNFIGKDWGTRITVPIRSENIELASGEYHVGLVTISNDYNSIQMEINLADDYVHFANNYNPSKRQMRLSYTKKNDGTFEIELKYIDEESDFSAKWFGLVKDKW